MTAPRPESSEIPDFLYHGTFDFRLPSIRDGGLDPAYSGENWSYSERLVYLTRTPKAAAAFAAGDHEFVPDGVETVVLRIDVSALDQNRLDWDRYVVGNFPANRDHFQYAGIVPPEAVSMMLTDGCEARPITETELTTPSP